MFTRMSRASSPVRVTSISGPYSTMCRPAVPSHQATAGTTAAAGPQRKLSESLAGGCGNAEEVDEHGFLPNGVLIGENAHGPVFAEDLQHPPGGVALGDDLVAVCAPQALHEAVHQGVVDRPDQNVQRTLDPAVGKRSQLPVAQVGRQKQDAPAARPPGAKALQADKLHVLPNLPLRPRRKLREGECDSADDPAGAAPNSPPLRGGEGGKRFPEVVLSRFPPPAHQQAQSQTDSMGDANRREGRQEPEQAEQADGRVKRKPIRRGQAGGSGTSPLRHPRTPGAWRHRMTATKPATGTNEAGTAIRRCCLREVAASRASLSGWNRGSAGQSTGRRPVEPAVAGSP